MSERVGEEYWCVDNCCAAYRTITTKSYLCAIHASRHFPHRFPVLEIKAAFPYIFRCFQGFAKKEGHICENLKS